MRIAIIIPCYNQAHYLCDAIDSALNQDIKEPYFIVVVNDGSTDDSLEAAQSYWANPDVADMVHIVDQKNQGLSMARNNGINYALLTHNVQYVLPLDSDDKIRRFMLRECVEALDANPKAAVAYPNIEEFGQSAEQYRQRQGTLRDLIEMNFMVCCSLIRTAAFLDVRRLNGLGYDPVMSELGGWEDWLFYMMIMALGWKAVYVDNWGFLYRKRGFSMITDAALKWKQLRTRQEEVMMEHFGIVLPPMKTSFDINGVVK